MKADVNPHLAFELRPETEHLRVALAAALAEALVADFRRNPPPLTSLRSSPEGEATETANGSRTAPWGASCADTGQGPYPDAEPGCRRLDWSMT